MSQNFSKVPDIYIPELLELDSYWQKAIEDAAYDTLKGEKKLSYALRNRNKIIQKLKQLGIESNPSQKNSGRFSRLNRFNPERLSSAPSAERPGPSGSKSRSLRDTPSEKHKSPGGPLLGGGSLEKMKKSQNSFNCEPMGTAKKNYLSESEEEEDEDEEEAADAVEKANAGTGERGRDNATPEVKDEKGKMIECLHVRSGGAFPDSDTDGSNASAFRIPGCHTTLRGASRKPFRDPLPIKGTVPASKDLERRLQLALAKREILHDNLRALRMSGSGNEIEIRNWEGKCRRKRLLTPFAKFYLKVYKELWHRCPVKDIDSEAARRWRAKSGNRARMGRN